MPAVGLCMRFKSQIGSFAIEVLVAALVAAAVAVPLLSLLFQERDTEQRSRFEYLAVLAARDAMYEARMAVAAGAQVNSIQHDWTILKDSPIERIKGMAPDLTINASYHPDQARVATKIGLESGSGRIRLATLQARWSDPAGTGAATPGKPERPTSLQIGFGVLLPPWATP